MFGLKVYDKLLLLVNFYFYLSHCNGLQNNTFLPPQLKSGGWTPIPTTSKNLKQFGSVDKIVSESVQVSSKVQQSSEHKNTQDSEMLPIPVIKPHRHGATLGFDLPEQGLTLYLDINELATKPLASNIGLKVVSHDSHQAQQSQTLNHVKPTGNLPARQNSGASSNNQLYNSGKESPLSQFVSKMQTLNNNKNNNINNNNNNNNNNSPKAGPITVAKIQKRVKAARNIGSYEGNVGSSNSESFSNHGSPAQNLKNSKPVLNKYHVGYVRPHDLNKALKQVGLTHGNGQTNNNNNNNNNYNNNHNNNNRNNNNLVNNNQKPSTRTVVINTHSVGNNINYDKLFNEPQTQPKNSALDTFSQNPNKFFAPISADKNIVSQTNTNGNQENGNRPVINSSPQPNSYTYSSQQMPIRPSVQFPIQEQEKERPQHRPEQPPVQQTSQEDDFENEVTIKRTTTAQPILPPQQEDQQQKAFDDEIEQTTEPFNDNRYEEPQRQVSNGEESQQQVDNDIAKQTTATPASNGPIKVTTEDETIIKPFPGPQPQDLADIMPQSCPVQQMCQQICDAKTDNLISEASNIREIIQRLKADAMINAFPSLEEELQNIIDFASSEGYTIILPSNEAVSRLPPNLFEFWKNNVNSLAPLLDNHVMESAQSLEEMRLAQIIQPRSGSKLRVQRAHNDSYTINGERVMIGNQIGPSGGQIHVIDGILYPNSEKDIMETLKSCNRLDGFVTLAEGTGFADTLKQSGPFTVFVPSNEALQKVPDNDLDVIRNNMTALREFLKYHVATGAHYSNDLKDGQFIPSMINGRYIQVGVRVDGCRRRLVEANVSPLYRADIPASNGVIHVVDWILKPTDRDWCENVILPR